MNGYGSALAAYILVRIILIAVALVCFGTLVGWLIFG